MTKTMMSMKMKTRRGKTNDSLLKTSLVVGSIVATFFGGDLLAKQDVGVEAETVSTPTQAMQHSDTQHNYSSDQPIVKLVIPEPVTRSQSSR